MCQGVKYSLPPLLHLSIVHYILFTDHPQNTNRGQARNLEDGQEMEPLNQTTKPISINQFRESIHRPVPSQEEFEQLNRIDNKDNVMKSKHAGMVFMQTGVPLNRC